MDYDSKARLRPENYLKNAEMQMEDDCNMIDGIINNGPKERPAANQPEACSVLEKLQAKKAAVDRAGKPGPKNAKKSVDQEL